MFVTFGVDGLFGAGLCLPLADGLGEAVGLLRFGRDITGFGEIDFEVTDDGFGDTENGLGDIDLEDTGDTAGFDEAGFGEAGFGQAGEADLVELSEDFFAFKEAWFVPVGLFPSTPMCFTKLGVTGFKPVLLRVVR